MDKNEFYDGDRILRVLIEKRLTPFKLALYIIPISFTYSLLLSFAATGPEYFLKSFNSLLWVFIITPALAGFYLWGSSVMPSLIERFKSSEAVVLAESDIKSIQKIYKNPRRQVLSLAFAIPFTIIYFCFHYTKESSNGDAILIPVLGHSLAFFLGAYITLMGTIESISDVGREHGIT